ncbi:MAG: M50 family metallopeptidase [Terracidiphilus sp.]
MPGLRQGSIHLFRFAGIDLFLHWSWFLVAAIEIEIRSGRYSSIAWNVLEYLSLFAIVLLHEFGHALACRQVGGTANRIVLWPLGGVAYVDPPQRPGATLWSIAAGPLVNVALLPLLLGAYAAAGSLGWAQTQPDAYRFVSAVLMIDAGLLAFNILPVYPLDGGQILRALLWFPLGRGRSLAAATVIGFIGIAGFAALALWQRSVWLLLICGYMLINCWSGLKGARILIRYEKLPRRQGFLCPGCRIAPPLGAHWRCAHCNQAFDTFESGAVCPHCGARFATTRCLHCFEQHPMPEWIDSAYGPSGILSGVAAK